MLIFILLCAGLLEANTNHNDSINFFSNFISNNDLVFDVGANIGEKSQIFLNCGANVICFEPQITCLEQLKQRFMNNGAVKIDSRGISSEPGQKEFFISSVYHTVSTCAEDWTKESRFTQMGYTWYPKIMIDVITLDQAIKQYGRPSFIKIDVENYEFEVLKGLSKPVKYLSFEFHQEYLQKTKSCIEYLLNLGYSKFNLALGETPKLMLDKWATADELFTKINDIITDRKIQNQSILWGDIYCFYDSAS